MSSILMTEAHKYILTKNRYKFVEALEVSEKLLNILSEDYILTAEMREDIESRKSRQAKVSLLLDLISRRPDRAFDKFIDALVQTSNEHLAELLDTSATARYRESRRQAKSRETDRVTSQSAPQSLMATNSGMTYPVAMVYPYTYPGMMQPSYPLMHPVYPMQFPGHNPFLYNQFAPSSYNSVGLQPNTMQQFSTPVEEIDKSVDGQWERLVTQFKEVVEFGSPYMNIDVPPVSNAEASRVINSELMYSMTHKVRGRAVIVCNQHFLRHHQTREGAEFDVANVKVLFTKLGFETVIYKDLIKNELLRSLNEERQKKCSSDHDAFVLFVLTHGHNGCIFTSDGEKITIDHLTTLFDGHSCPALDGKPKLFFIQACQGNKKASAYSTDGPTNVQASVDDFSLATATQTVPISNEENAEIHRKLAEMSLEDQPGYVLELPSVNDTQHHKADMLIAHATVKDYEAWRNIELGSWFVRSLVYVISREAHSSDLVSMLTKVNFFLSNLRTRGTTVPYRQVAEKIDSLRKKLYFLPGYVSV